MHRLLNALFTIMSFAGILSGISVAPAVGQDNSAIREPDAAVNGSGPSGSQPLVLPPGVTHDNVEVKNRPLIIEGDVKGSVRAVNSRVTLMPGAVVEGNLTLIGGTLAVAPTASGMIAAPSTKPSLAVPTRRRDWFGGQLCLWLLGLAGGLIVLVAAPNATTRVAETVVSRPGRSLLVGMGCAVAMVSLLAVSGMIMHAKTIFSVLWMPVTVVLAVASVALLMFGWLTGVRRVGDLLAQRFGQTGSGAFYGRMALGLTTFFIANAIAGGIAPGLGAVGLVVEFAVALMGVGAIVQTAFGRAEPLFGRRFGGYAGPGIR